MTRHAVGTVVVGLALLLPFTLGCGGGSAKPRGKITMNGQPVKLSDKGVLQVAFVPEPNTAGNVYPALVKPDGSFEVPGPDKKGIPAGKYKVTVRVYDPYPSNDMLANKYGPESTPIVKNVPKDDLNIDVSK